MDYIVHGILQARILEWVAIPCSRGSSQPRDWTQVSHIAGRLFISWATREAWSFLITLFKISTPLPTAAFLGSYPALHFSIVLTNTSGILYVVHIHLLWVSCTGCKLSKSKKSYLPWSFYSVYRRGPNTQKALNTDDECISRGQLRQEAGSHERGKNVPDRRSSMCRGRCYGLNCPKIQTLKSQPCIPHNVAL